MPPSPTGAVGRNDPCPCGSGRKFKQCCLKTGAAPPRTAPAPSWRERLDRATAQHRRGQLDVAAAGYRSLLAERPKDTTVCMRLGEILGTMGDPDEAIDLLRRAGADRGLGATPHVILAHQLNRIGRFDEALAAADRAVRLDPRHADAHYFRALACERLNRLDDAAAAAARVLALAPDKAEAAVLLARLDRRAGDADAAVARLEPVVADEPAPSIAVPALRELGFARDATGDSDAAFAAFREAGRLEMESPAARRIDPNETTALLDRYEAALTDVLIARWRDQDLDPLPVRLAFLVGFPRSGTTMTEQVVAAHPDVVTAEEKPLVDGLLDDLRVATETWDVPDALGHVKRDQLLAIRAAYLDRARVAADGDLDAAAVFVDKLPLNLVHLGVINAVFPEATVIVAERDPRDVCLSCFMQDFQLNAAMIHFRTIEDTAAFHTRIMAFWRTLRERLTLDVTTVRYEDLVTDLPGQARRLLEALGVPWDDAVVAFHEHARTRRIATPSATAVIEPVHTRAAGRWRRYETHLAPVLPVLADSVRAMGYDA